MFDSAQKTAILVIGDEILSGKTQDTNSSWLAQQLGQLGLPVGEIRVVSDVQEEIVAALNALRAKYKYVFTTGGIGPTHDDITSDSIASAFGIAINIDSEARRRLADYMGEENLNEARLRMARIPAGATLLDNAISAAPGFNVENVYVLPGVPHIMKAMFEGMKSQLEAGKPIIAKAVMTKLKEGAIAAQLGEIQQRFPSTGIGSYPTYNDMGTATKLIVRGTDLELIMNAVDAIKQMVMGLGDTPVEMDV